MILSFAKDLGAKYYLSLHPKIYKEKVNKVQSGEIKSIKESYISPTKKTQEALVTLKRGEKNAIDYLLGILGKRCKPNYLYYCMKG